MDDREFIYEELGLLIAKERKRRNLTQREFGAMVGMSRTSITNIERGRQTVQVHQLFAFAHALHIEASVLLPKIAVPIARRTDALDQVASVYIAKVKEMMPIKKTTKDGQDQNG